MLDYGETVEIAVRGDDEADTGGCASDDVDPVADAGTGMVLDGRR
ncbi:MAG TPA: hypothetical protein VKF62_10060 [Planctomycetota bacterium]|nr:hypothetical protein [Planctomycetota bacterium]